MEKRKRKARKSNYQNREALLAKVKILEETLNSKNQKVAELLADVNTNITLRRRNSELIKVVNENKASSRQVKLDVIEKAREFDLLTFWGILPYVTGKKLLLTFLFKESD